ncbi:phage upper tail fiber protein [Lacticaseibacillus zhaodongensis]|uniref:phage upper tail fiber protein n=1 Tax=Lacticaseibacillus zhaodongensis TaxID=2668065 RepID=UPI0018AF5E18|nr:collagen-like protein [Lacticaseibacillus zhaodongensis]
MADEMRSVFTSAGMALAQDALAGKVKITFTRGVASIADWSQRTADDLRGVTKLADETQVTGIGGIDTEKQADGSTSPDKIDVSLIFSQGAIKTDYAMSTVGLFAAPVVDGKQGDEVLYTVTTFSKPQWMSQDNNGSTITLKVSTIIGDTAQLTVILASAQGEGGLSQGELDVFKAQLDKEYDGKYVKLSSLPDDTGAATGDNPVVTKSYLVKYLADNVVGKPGADGASAYEVWVKAGNTGSQDDYLKSLIGPKGADGNSVTGPKGDQGPAGPAGPKGDTGPIGPAGPKGDAGPTGATGPAGTVAIGTVTKGDTAAVTNAGTPQAAKLNFTLPKGDTGAQGPKGDTGATGPKGDTGPQGPTGPAGKDAPANAVLQPQLGGITQFVTISAADYNKLATKDPTTLYLVSES